VDKALLLVDFENVQHIDLSAIDDTSRVIVFLGANQKNLPTELVAAAQKLGDRLEWLKIEGSGTNALDFHIAWYLGRVFESSRDTRCIVLSKDKGFDPLLRHLNKLGLVCQRVENLAPSHAQSVATEDADYKRVVEVLRKSDKKTRPRKRKTLSQHILSMFKKDVGPKDVNRIIGTLLANGMIAESNNTITYSF